MRTALRTSEARDSSRAWRREGLTVGVVPTMGALHEGHLSLIDLARAGADRVIVTVFVNPTQFGPSEDFDRYPRNLERDLELCRKRGADLVFAPAVGEMYAPDRCTEVNVEGSLTRGLCAASRPGHFHGVATVVAKLFHITEPDVAVFGRKDAQQLAVIRRMARDLDFPVAIVPAPIVREPDGLAMSSRNAYLAPEERQEAPVLHRTLEAARKRFLGGERNASVLTREAARSLRAAPLLRLQYVELVDEETMEPLQFVERRALLAVAVHYGRARLIDNVVLDSRPDGGGTVPGGRSSENPSSARTGETAPQPPGGPRTGR